MQKPSEWTDQYLWAQIEYYELSRWRITEEMAAEIVKRGKDKPLEVGLWARRQKEKQKNSEAQ